jgi:hypothetical protein
LLLHDLQMQTANLFKNFLNWDRVHLEW